MWLVSSRTASIELKPVAFHKLFGQYTFAIVFQACEADSGRLYLNLEEQRDVYNTKNKRTKQQKKPGMSA